MKNNILINNNGNCNKEITIKNNYPLLYNIIIKHNQLFGDITWTCKVYNYINNIIKTQKCPICKTNLKFNTFKLGYKKYCSIKCAVNSSEFKIKKENTLLRKYGVNNVSKSQIIKEKKESTLLKNYGVTHPLKSNQIKKRVIETNIKHWRVENPSQSNIIKNKKKLTSQINYGVDYNFQSEIFKKNNIISSRNNYGVDYYVQSKKNKLNVKNSINQKRINFWAKYLKINSSNIIISGNTFIIKNLCNQHALFKINKYNLYNRTIGCNNTIENICTICNPISKNSSIKENEIRNFIENNLNIKTKKIKINNKEIDIYLSDNKLGIEFNGLYWHSNLFKDKNYHLNKTELCEKNDIQLLHVFEDEWIYKKEIVKSIIKSKLGLIDNKIFGRKTEIKEINDNKLIRKFLEVNHIQGFVGSKVKLGLFYENELVSIMTFGKKRIFMGNKVNIEGEYEMLRFCNKLNTTIIGGASKLLKYFIKNYQPKSIISFADRRYSQGKLYEKLGFKFIGNTRPNYYYFIINEMIRYHRFKFRKNILVNDGYDSTKTEFQIMHERNYLRIFDSGNIKYINIL